MATDLTDRKPVAIVPRGMLRVSAPESLNCTGVQAVAFSRRRGTLGNPLLERCPPVKIPFQTGNGITLGSSAFDVRRAYSNYGYEDTGRL